MKRLIHHPRIAPAAVIGIVAALLLIGVGMLLQNERVYQQQKLSELEMQANIVAASTTAALDFRDVATGEEVARALAVNPLIRSATIRDAEGRFFAGFSRPSDAGAPVDQSPNLITTEVPVLRGGERIGSVALTVAREPIFRRFTRYTMLGLLVLLATTSVAVLGFAQGALRRANRDLKDRAVDLAATNRELEIQMDERARAEEELRQAQKMQALGQLTGGIAHDFNNLLTVIQGSADILQRPNLPEEKRTRFAAAIAQTAGRAASLTSQLLSFARRQPLKPETLDLNEHVVEMVDLLDRTLGELVLVKTELADVPCLVDADPVQLESAILNIAVNARDAMPEGGTLTLRTAPGTLESGPAVALSVSDTGTGMDAETLARVFEPFFTTKAVGKGTGLGLSQVYGFATQSGGEVRVDSEPGKGTTVTLLLPCSAATRATSDEQADDVAPGPASGTLLLVDDNEEVSAFASTLLAELGYDVVRASSADEALARFDEGGIDLVFTDVVMPGTSGIDLAQHLRERAPGLPIVLTTGYSDELAAGASEFPVLLKPYKLDALTRALDKARRSGGG